MSVEKDEEHFRRYLIGEMTEEERAALEERYFADDGTFARLLAEEDALVAAYLRGTLPGAERERFEATFLGSADGRRRLQLARDLGRRAAGPALSRPVSTGRPSRRWMAAVAATVVLAAFALSWRMRDVVPRPPVSPRRAANPTGPVETARPGPPSPGAGTIEATPPVVPSGNVLTVILAAGLVRDVGASRAFAIPPDTAAVRLHLLTSAHDDVRYRVSIQTPEGVERADSPAATVPPAKGSRAVEVDVPAAALAPGTYIALLSGITRDGRAETVAEYTFRVTRPSASAQP